MWKSGNYSSIFLERQLLTAFTVLIISSFVAAKTNVSSQNQDLSVSELTPVFGLPSYSNLSGINYQIITIQRRNFQGKHKRHGQNHQEIRHHKRSIRFSAWNSTFVIELEPNHVLLSPHMTTVIRDAEKMETFRGLPGNLSVGDRDCHFSGRVISHGGIPAAISDCGDHFTGIIDQGDHFLVIQSVRGIAAPGKYIIYKDRKPTFNEVQQTEDIPFALQMYQQQMFRIPKINKNPYTTSDIPLSLELAVFVDWTLYEHFRQQFSESKNIPQHIADYILAFVNNAHVIFQYMTPRLNIAIVRFEPCFSMHPDSRPDDKKALLSAFCEYQEITNPGDDLTDPEHWDHGVMLTGQHLTNYAKNWDPDTSITGVARVGSMCDKSHSCSIVRGRHLGYSFTLAHELGHSLGMTHDGVGNECERDCCLMSPSSGPIYSGNPWSDCSVHEFNEFLRELDGRWEGNCLCDPAENFPRYNHFSGNRLPGQRFPADQQCHQFGPDFTVYELFNEKYICHYLLCYNGQKLMGTDLPLEGTWCGGQNWCRGGLCLPSNASLEPGMLWTPLIPVNGKWSKWATLDNHCQVNKINGSVSFISQFRSCSKPYPNNGGRRCEGARKRDLVCHRNKKHDRIPRKAYGDEFCLAKLKDVTNPNGEDLKGFSSLSEKHPCQLLCHTLKRDYFLGPLPNGTPCGDGKYCFEGLCVGLNCNGSAILQTLNEVDCPSKDELQKQMMILTYS